MTLTRRDAGTFTIGAILAAALGGTASNAGETRLPDTGHDMSGMPASWHGNEKIAFLVYPQFTALDVVGPHYMLGNLMGATTMLVAKSLDPVMSDMKFAIVPTHTFETCPADLDVICVPGGTAGTLAAMEDKETIAFLKDRGSRAKYICSVCTGSLVLGAAGLLNGYKATSHWVTRDVLPEFGAIPVDQRVVFDRNRVTGAGVTAGLDFGLSLVAKMRDDSYAQSLQLLAEYAPDPPFNSGTPSTAPKESLALMTGMFTEFVAKAREAAQRTVNSQKP